MELQMYVQYDKGKLMEHQKYVDNGKGKLMKQKIRG